MGILQIQQRAAQPSCGLHSVFRFLAGRKPTEDRLRRRAKAPSTAVPVEPVCDPVEGLQPVLIHSHGKQRLSHIQYIVQRRDTLVLRPHGIDSYEIADVRCFAGSFGERSAFGVGILQGSTKLRTTATIQFVADGLGDELAAVILSPVNVSDEVVG